jgi:hypothetical protein
MKTCKICERLLDLSDFYRTGGRTHSWCKVCYLERLRELRAARAAGEPAPSIRG